MRRLQESQEDPEQVGTNTNAVSNALPLRSSVLRFSADLALWPLAGRDRDTHGGLLPRAFHVASPTPGPPADGVPPYPPLIYG